jgi:hypothetical protein
MRCMRISEPRHQPRNLLPFYLISCNPRYDGIWQEGVVKCGSYSEVQPAPPGAPGALPCIELCSPAGVLQEGAAAALGLAS